MSGRELPGTLGPHTVSGPNLHDSQIYTGRGVEILSLAYLLTYLFTRQSILFTVYPNNHYLTSSLPIISP